MPHKQEILRKDQIERAEKMIAAAKTGDTPALSALIKKDGPFLISYGYALLQVATDTGDDVKSLENLLQNPAIRQGSKPFMSTAMQVYELMAAYTPSSSEAVLKMLLEPFRQDQGLKDDCLKYIFGASANADTNPCIAGARLLEESGADKVTAYRAVTDALQEQRGALQKKLESVHAFAQKTAR